jgi:hypothetical protein
MRASSDAAYVSVTWRRGWLGAVVVAVVGVVAVGVVGVVEVAAAPGVEEVEEEEEEVVVVVVVEEAGVSRRDGNGGKYASRKSYSYGADDDDGIVR